MDPVGNGEGTALTANERSPRKRTARASLRLGSTTKTLTMCNFSLYTTLVLANVLKFLEFLKFPAWQYDDLFEWQRQRSL